MSNLSQFYTNEDIAKNLIETVNNKYNFKDFDYLLEPSAGKGSFYKNLLESKRIGIDIDPKCEGIIKQDFLLYEPVKDLKYLSIGNPPFGIGCSLAVKFFNKCAEFSNVIAFIIPRTFRRISIQNQLNLNFHCVYDETLGLKPCIFNPPMNAKCCFQIWIKKESPREVIKLEKNHPDWNFIALGPKDSKNQPTCPTNIDFVIKAYGGKCGEIKKNNLKELRPKSWHWIKVTENIKSEDLIKRFQSLDYSISEDTVRQNSIGQKELIKLYKDKYN